MLEISAILEAFVYWRYIEIKSADDKKTGPISDPADYDVGFDDLKFFRSSTSTEPIDNIDSR